MTVLNPPRLRIRAATPRDLDAMATIMYQAMPLDPQWDYRFPHRRQFPEDNYGCTRRMLQGMLEQDGVYYIQVATFPSPCLKEDEEVPAALAVWQLDQDPDGGYSDLAKGKHPEPRYPWCFLNWIPC